MWVISLPSEFTIDGGEMTPKLSLKRKVILTKNADLIEKIYAEGGDRSEHHV